MDSSHTIRLWVNYLKLPSEYSEMLINEGFDDVEFLSDITEEDMNEIGINKRGHVKRIMKFVAKFDEESTKFYKKYQIVRESKNSDVKSPVNNNVNMEVRSQEHIGHGKKRIKRMRNTKTQTNESEVNVTTTKIPFEIVENEICKELFYFVKKCIVLLESGYTERFLTSAFHPVDQSSLKTLNYSIPELLKMFEEGETNISKVSMLELLKRFIEVAKDWIVHEYVVECDGHHQKGENKEENCFDDRYGGKYAATFQEKLEGGGDEVDDDDEEKEKEIPRKIHLRYFRAKWYLTNFS